MRYGFVVVLFAVVLAGSEKEAGAPVTVPYGDPNSVPRSRPCVSSAYP
jgi:hypothetical protein